jgi:hypothetical protein
VPLHLIIGNNLIDTALPKQSRVADYITGN